MNNSYIAYFYVKSPDVALNIYKHENENSESKSEYCEYCEDVTVCDY